MRQIISLLFLLLFARATFGQQQIPIPRIEQMPNMPTPYQMRDWKQVAVDYDNYVFNVNKTGAYLPITAISSTQGTNYPSVLQIKMDTYVGQNNHGNVAEAINIIPAVVGASLVGVDKTNHFNTNWVTKIKDFFNLKNGQHVYLNNYNAATGSDWWYEVMPNVFFYQLYSLYPNADMDFGVQFKIVADKQLEVLKKLGGSFMPWQTPYMNYRAFNLLTGKPNSTSVPEPETAGSIAWILYQAYMKTGNSDYLQGAQLALDFLQSWSTNPSYELQLPYGIAVAARMNAVENTNYNIDKLLNWTFSSGQNTLRGWGAIVGNWNGYDVSGLIGEANDKGNDYAFSLNGFQHAAALAPVVKYDKRYARAIGKWILNLANASRLYYWNALPKANQQSASYNWASQNDPNACIPYEAIKQTWNGVSPTAMGDAVKGGWAQTDLSMYSGSSVGYLAAIIQKTNIDGILQIDLNKTDFNGNNTYPNYLYFNPTNTVKSVRLDLPSGNFTVYDAISETVLQSDVSATVSIDVNPDNVRLIVIYPSDKTVTSEGRLKKAGNVVIDYNAGYDFSKKLRIKSFASADTIIQKSTTMDFYCLTENSTGSTMNFDWYENDVKKATTQTGSFTWTAPSTSGYYNVKCKVSDGPQLVESRILKIKVVDELLVAPVISDIVFADAMPLAINSFQKVSAKLNTPNINYVWTVSSGTLANNQSASPTWNLPSVPGVYSITATVSNSTGNNSFTKSVLVKNLADTQEPTPLIYYPFNGNTKNNAQDAFHATSVNAVLTQGPNNIANGGYLFPTSASYIYTQNASALNFQDKIAISFWVKPDQLPNSEQFIISHGSWEERYKVSIIPERKVRWTVKTNNAIVDVDADSIIQVGKYYHYTATYTGYSVELYLNGKLVGFKPLSGNIQTTNKNITIGRKDNATTDWSLRGSVDEVRIYNDDLSQKLIKLLPEMFELHSGLDDNNFTIVNVFPNPTSNEVHIQLPNNEFIEKKIIYNTIGEIVLINDTNDKIISIGHLQNGIYYLKLITSNDNKHVAKIIKE